MSLRKYLGFLPGVRTAANLYRGLKFLKRAIVLRNKLAIFDQSLPFKGKLSKLGYAELNMSHTCCQSLRKLKNENLVSDSAQYASVKISKKYGKAIAEIFDVIEPEVRSYLGAHSFLDGINWMITLPKSGSISGSWHTDNVGARLKLFLCVEGDGSQPTVVLPNSRRVPNLRDWLFQTLNEARRWFGFKFDNKLKQEIMLKHRTGSSYLFDTQLLHRGGYEKSISGRIIFHMEFSNPEKHVISRGPIGSKTFNSFLFDEDLMKIQTFRSMLDPDRLQKEGENYFYGQKSTKI